MDGLESWLIHYECDHFYVAAFCKPINLPDGVTWIDARTLLNEAIFNDMLGRGHRVPHVADYVRLLAMGVSQHGRAIFADGDAVVIKKMLPPRIVRGHWFATLQHNPVS